jgi:hypothetical protein
MPTFETDTFDAPAHWASALLNGDLTSFEYYGPESLAEYETWCSENPELVETVVDCNDDTFIGRFNGVQTELLTYATLKAKQ